METGNLATPGQIRQETILLFYSLNFTTVSKTPQIWLEQAFSILLLALNVSVFKNSFQH